MVDVGVCQPWHFAWPQILLHAGGRPPCEANHVCSPVPPAERFKSRTQRGEASDCLRGPNPLEFRASKIRQPACLEIGTGTPPKRVLLFFIVVPPIQKKWPQERQP